jgi:hypothetical protein
MHGLSNHTLYSCNVLSTHHTCVKRKKRFPTYHRLVLLQKSLETASVSHIVTHLNWQIKTSMLPPKSNDIDNSLEAPYCRAKRKHNPSALISLSWVRLKRNPFLNFLNHIYMYIVGLKFTDEQVTSLYVCMPRWRSPEKSCCFRNRPCIMYMAWVQTELTKGHLLLSIFDIWPEAEHTRTHKVLRFIDIHVEKRSSLWNLLAFDNICRAFVVSDAVSRASAWHSADESEAVARILSFCCSSFLRWLFGPLCARGEDTMLAVGRLHMWLLPSGGGNSTTKRNHNLREDISKSRSCCRHDTRHPVTTPWSMMKVGISK